MEGALHRDFLPKSTTPHKSTHEPQSTSDDPQPQFSAQNVCDAERPKGEALTTAGAQNVIVGAERERKSLA
jgi:hypothetical protein